MTEECGWKDRASSAGLLVLRVFMGLAMAQHGYQKIFGGIMPQMAEGVTKMGLPAPHLLAWLAALSEFAGALLIVLGLGTRVAAFFVFFTMGVAFFIAHAQDPFQVKELVYLYGVVSFSLILTGAGRYSLDALWCRKKGNHVWKRFRVPKMNRKEHWETVYQTKSTTEVSWFQEKPAKSLELIRDTGVGHDAVIIDVGGGASTLADHLLSEGYRHITVLDISAKALESARQRLGERARDIQWVEGDITQVDLPPASCDIWHDRAVFHFLTEPEDRKRYRMVMERSLKPGGHVLLSTFASDGPVRCSGLEVVRYSVEGLRQELGDRYRLLKSLEETHKTPFETEQKFIYGHFQRT